MAPSLLLTVPAGDGTGEQISVGPDGMQAKTVIVTSHEAEVGAGLAGDDDGSDADGGLPLGIVIVVLVLLVAAAAAMVLGFRSTRRKTDVLDDQASREGKHLRPEDRRPS